MIMDSIEQIIGYHCAPTIRGIKIANLVSIPQEMSAQLCKIINDYNFQFNEKGLYFFQLCACKERRLLLVFRKKQLEEYVRQHQHIGFLSMYGYQEDDPLEALLLHLRHRMETEISFPHEIGLFLGYPLDDVIHFIASKGQNYQLCGEWKVYHHAISAQHSFHCFKICREYCHQQLVNGKSFSSLVAKTA